MFRSRTRALTNNKQALKNDHSSTQSSPSQSLPSSSESPRCSAFISKPGQFETESLLSPSSNPEMKPFPHLGKGFFYQPRSPKVFLGNKHSWENSDAKGLAFINELNDEATHRNSSIPGKEKLSFSPKIGVQISPRSPPTTELSICQTDFGIKTRNSRLLANGSVNSGIRTKDFPLVLREMELSEEYTCVISHGPNPRTTHIFDNWVVNTSSRSFLSFCHTCKRNLGQKNDIYIYRGEKAFCSHECREQEMLSDTPENSDARRNST